MVRVNLEFLEPQEVFMFPQDVYDRGQFALSRGVVLLSTTWMVVRDSGLVESLHLTQLRRDNDQIRHE